MIIQKETAGSIVLKCEALLQLPELGMPTSPPNNKNIILYHLKTALALT